MYVVIMFGSVIIESKLAGVGLSSEYEIIFKSSTTNKSLITKIGKKNES